MHWLILISVHLLAVINRCVILIRCSVEKMKGRDKMKRRPTDAYLVSVLLANNLLAVIMADLVEVARKSIWGTERAVAHSPLIVFIIFPIMFALCDPFCRSPFFTTCISYIFLFKSLITVRLQRSHLFYTSTVWSDPGTASHWTCLLPAGSHSDPGPATCFFLYRIRDLWITKLRF